MPLCSALINVEQVCRACYKTFKKENLDPLLNFQQLGKAAIANAVVQMNRRLNKAVEEPDVESVASDSDESMETTTPSNV
jgi:hypothetical protein